MTVLSLGRALVFLFGFPFFFFLEFFFRIFILFIFLAKGKSTEVKADIDGKIQSSVSQAQAKQRVGVAGGKSIQGLKMFKEKLITKLEFPNKKSAT